MKINTSEGSASINSYDIASKVNSFQNKAGYTTRSHILWSPLPLAADLELNVSDGGTEEQTNKQTN